MSPVGSDWGDRLVVYTIVLAVGLGLGASRASTAEGGGEQGGAPEPRELFSSRGSRIEREDLLAFEMWSKGDRSGDEEQADASADAFAYDEFDDVTAAYESLSTLFSDRGVESVLPIEVDRTLMASSESMKLGGDLDLSVNRWVLSDGSQRPGAALFVGDIREEDGQALLVEEEGRIFGWIRTADEVQEIVSLPGGGQLLARIDLSKLPTDHGRPEAPRPPGDWLAQMVRPTSCESTAASREPARIDVLVVYTDAAHEASSQRLRPIESLLEMAMEETNHSLEMSGVPVRFAHRLQPTNYEEIGVLEEDLDAVVGGEGGAGEIHELREQFASDLVVVVVEDQTACGEAGGIGPPAPSAFAVVSWRCALYTLTLAHELGHLLGARHDPEFDAESKPFPFQHGYVLEADGASFRTIMALRRSGSSAERIPRWSTPHAKFNHRATGSVEFHNNACVVAQTATTVAAFR